MLDNYFTVYSLNKMLVEIFTFSISAMSAVEGKLINKILT